MLNYKKGTKPNGYVSEEEINEIKGLLFSTIKKTEEDYNNQLFKNYQEYTVSTTGNTLFNINDALSFVLQNKLFSKVWRQVVRQAESDCRDIKADLFKLKEKLIYKGSKDLFECFPLSNMWI